MRAKVSRAAFLAGLAALLTWGMACGSDGETMESPSSFPEARLGEAFSLRVGDTVLISGTSLTITFRRVENDSRCPRDVNCIRAGEAEVVLHLESGGGQGTELVLEVPPEGGAEADFRGFEIRIEELNPPAEAEKKIDPSAYVATMIVTS
jgi:hypothetical protein